MRGEGVRTVIVEMRWAGDLVAWCLVWLLLKKVRFGQSCSYFCMCMNVVE